MGYPVVFKLIHCTTLNAYEMMVLVYKRSAEFIKLFTLCQFNFPQNPQFHHDVERSINGRRANFFTFARELLINFFSAQMLPLESGFK